MAEEGELLERMLWRAQDIEARVVELGRAISDYFKGLPVVVIGVATGASMFAADLIRHIALPLQVEDIIDPGITLAKLMTHFSSKGATSVLVCVLLDKISHRVVPLKLLGTGKCCVGFECPNYFVVGYGMDCAEQFRSLPCVGVLKPEVYQEQRR